MFDPIAASRTQRFTKQELKTFWQGPGRIVQRTKEENPVLYKQLQDAGVEAGVIGKSLAPNPAPNVYKPPTRSYTPQDLKLHGEFSESYCTELFASDNAKAATALSKADPERYQDAKDAAISYGVLPARTSPRPAPAPVAVPEPLHRISPELAAESGLPRDVELPWAQVELLCAQKVARARKVQADADAKADADKQSELATLTARQQADQAVRDQKQRDLQRLSELITPKPIVTPEPIALETARAIAQERKSVEVPIIGQ
jgi:hypothetical protein